MQGKYRVRFAPSPTGRLHKGHLFSAWFAAEFADNGRIFLRMEDIDLARCKPEYEQLILQDLMTFGIEYIPPPFRQSERFSEYKAAAVNLRKEGYVYPCFCSRKQVAFLSAAHGPDGPIYSGHCKSLSVEVVSGKIEAGEPYTLRLDTAKAEKSLKSLFFHDLKHDMIPVNFTYQGDPVIAGKEYPTSYHLSCVIDDAAQGIELITRGEDLLPACHIQRILQELLSLPVPEYLHHPLVLDENGQRLAKRSQSYSLDKMLEDGQTAETLREEFESWFAEFMKTETYN